MGSGGGEHLAGLEMLLTNSVSTCLSPTVHYMVCELGYETKANHDINTIVSNSGEINWETITKHVQYKEADYSVDYIKSVRSLGPICDSVHLQLQSLIMEQFQNQFMMWFSWTNCSEIFVRMFDALKSSETTVISLCLMKLTSCLERALGDVFLLIGKDCPFLLRDLLASQELATIFGQSVMDVLKVFIGSPNGLNLRNILWHGFASPQEIPVKYSSMLLFLTVGLGQLLKNYLLQTQFTLVHRSFISFANLQELHIFPDLNHELISLAENLVVNSSIVLTTMLPFWITALTSFRQNRFADCVILLLPQLECGLRLLFTTVNKCPSRLMTAESSSLYTTFDEMLAKELNNEVNQLPLVLGESRMAFLWDFLNHQEGPRIRDHLSHGEFKLNDFPREIANSVLAFSITLLCRFSKDDIATVKDHTVLEPLMSCANGYCSKFHPIAKLRKQILKCMKSITLWSDLPKVPEEKVQEEARSEKDTADIPWICVTADIFALLQPYLSQKVTLLDDPVNSHLIEMLLIELCSKNVCILFYPRSVLEIVVVLRQIATQCRQVLSQVISACETRYVQWMNKSLRSRQRNNYLRMKRSIKLLSPVLQLILILISLEVAHIHTASEKNPSEYQQYLKFLKMILRYMENLVTYTSAEKNKWEETVELTHKALINIRTFLEKQLTLAQLAW